jgi:hypothetical protein
VEGKLIICKHDSLICSLLFAAKMKDKSDVSSKLEAKWKSASENAIESGENHQPFLEGQRTVKYAPLYRQVRLSLFLGVCWRILIGAT